VIKYFYIISITWNVHDTPHHGLHSGVVTVEGEATQDFLFQHLLAGVCEVYDVLREEILLNHYYLARDEL
jgi:hypothetical protein